MRRGHRAAHRWVWLLLAPGLLALVALAWRARPVWEDEGAGEDAGGTPVSARGERGR